VIAAGNAIMPIDAFDAAELCAVWAALSTEGPERLHDAVIDAHRRRAYGEGLALVLEGDLPTVQAALYLLAASYFELASSLGEA
jgi:hypothetical protein